MNELKKFNFEGNQVRTIMVNEEPWFVGSEIAKILDYSNPHKAVRDHVDDEDKLTERIVQSGQTRNVIIINESGLYSLILKSKKPEAKRFKRWVTSEVLPTIRKHGAYMTQETIEKALLSPETLIKLATEIKEEREAKQREHEGRLIAEQQVQELKPKADYCDTILQNPGLVTITQISKDYGMSGQKMNALLHELGVQYKQGTTWLLYAKHQAKGWTQSETSLITTKDGVQKTVFNTKWTQKGRLGLYELLKGHDVLPMIERGA